MTTTHHSVRVRTPVSWSKIIAVATAAASRTTSRSTSSKASWKLLARGGEEETMRKQISSNMSALLRVPSSPRHTSSTYGSLSPFSLFSPFSSSCSSSLRHRQLLRLHRHPSPTSILPTKVSNKDPRGSRPTSTASSMVENWRSHLPMQA